MTVVLLKHKIFVKNIQYIYHDYQSDRQSILSKDFKYLPLAMTMLELSSDQVPIQDLTSKEYKAMINHIDLA